MLAGLALAGNLSADSPASATLIGTPPLPPERTVWVDFEVLAADSSRPLPETLRSIESVKLAASQAVVGARTFRKASATVTATGGVRWEIVALLEAEPGGLRTLGVNRIERREASSEHRTIVFDSGPTNPLSGERVVVPADTYTWLSLTAGLADEAIQAAPQTAHLWSASRARAVEIRADGRETLAVLGTETATRRIVARADGIADAAVYWLSDKAPHPLLQYRGPAEFLGESTEPVLVLLRATASSEQLRELYER